MSTAGTSYFKGLWHRHAHAKFTRRRAVAYLGRALFLVRPCGFFYRRSAASRRDLSAVAVTASRRYETAGPNKGRTRLYGEIFRFDTSRYRDVSRSARRDDLFRATYPAHRYIFHVYKERARPFHYPSGEIAFPERCVYVYSICISAPLSIIFFPLVDSQRADRASSSGSALA